MDSLLRMFDRLLVRLGLKRAIAPTDPQHLRILYLNAALQYHIAARYAAFAGFVPVCGVLFHHAIEMYLKGQLCLNLSETQLKKLGHKLKKVWKRFKKELPNGSLARYDRVVLDLDRHELIRYPETIASRGMIGMIDFKPATTRGVQSPTTRPEPMYTISVDELDGLAKAILDKSRVNPQFFTVGLNTDANAFLKRDNKFPIW